MKCSFLRVQKDQYDKISLNINYLLSTNIFSNVLNFNNYVWIDFNFYEIANTDF